MGRVASTALEALGALIAAGLIVGVALLLFGCSRPTGPSPALDCPSSIPPREPPAAPVLEDGECHGDDCLLPKPKR